MPPINSSEFRVQSSQDLRNERAKLVAEFFGLYEHRADYGLARLMGAFRAEIEEKLAIKLI